MAYLALAIVASTRPADALAGTYTWTLPGNFTLSGANPDRGPYGDAPWRYLDGPSAAALRSLDSFQSSVQGGLVGWTDASDTSVLVGTDPQEQSISGGPRDEDTFAPGQMVLQPTSGRVAAIGWTSPAAATVQVAITLVSDETAGAAGSACGSVGWDTWSLAVNGQAVAGQSGTVPSSAHGPESTSAAVTLSAGDSLELVVNAGQAATADPGCAPVGATMQVMMPSATPAPALGQPAPGSTVVDGEPTFSGGAADGFGDSSTVTLRIYRGSAVAPGSLAETLTAQRSGSAFTASPDPILYDGAYTIQAEQDDLAGDSGFSQPVTFELAVPAPDVMLASLGHKQLATRTPFLHGSAGTLAADSTQIEVFVWAGSKPDGYPARHLSAVRGPHGRWRLRIEPALPDGRYVAIAAQNSPAGLIGSHPIRFRVGAGVKKSSG